MYIKDKYLCGKCMQIIDAENDEDICPHCGYDPYPLFPNENPHHLPEGVLLNNGRYLLGVVTSDRSISEIIYSAWDNYENRPVTIREYFPRIYADRDTNESNCVRFKNWFEDEFAMGRRRFYHAALAMQAFDKLSYRWTVYEVFIDNETAYAVTEFTPDPSDSEIPRPTDPHHLPEYTFLAGDKFMLGPVLGSGNFGITYAAWNTTLKSVLAIKEFFPKSYAQRESVPDEKLTVADICSGSCNTEVKIGESEYAHYADGLRRFTKEARYLAMFEGLPGVVWVHDHLEENGTAYILEEFVEGQTLKAFVAANRPKTQTLLQMMRSVLDSLVTIHEAGIVHRDITPSNLIVQQDNTVKIIDFGSILDLNDNNTTSFATAHYAPPEQFVSDMKQGPFSDVYGVCATFYHMITGKKPQDSVSRMDRDHLQRPSKLEYPPGQEVHLTNKQEQALMNGLILDTDKRTQSIKLLRSRLFNLPLPEEEIQRRAFVRKVTAIAASIAALCILVVLNFTVGIPADDLVLGLGSGGWHVLRSHTDSMKYTVPERFLGLPVSAINRNAFSDADWLSSVIIPDSVTRIADQAFLGCDRLKDVIIGNSVESIGSYAFANCPQLHTVEIEASDVHISETAFEGAWERLMLWGKRGDSVSNYAAAQNIDFADRSEYVFVDVSDVGIEILEFNPSVDITDNLVLPSYVDGRAVGSLNENLKLPDVKSLQLPMCLIRFDENIQFPETLTSIDFGEYLTAIPDNAFMYSNLTSAVLPDSVLYIGTRAFYGAPLESITLPENMMSIGSEAFSSTMLRKVQLPAALKRIGTDVFANTPLFSVDFPVGTTTVNKDYFTNCEKLSYIVLPDGMEKIESRAFANCKSLKQIVIPDSVTSIASNAFTGCEDVSVICGKYSHAWHFASDNDLYFINGLDLLNEVYSERAMTADDLPFHLPQYQIYANANPGTKTESGDPEAQYKMGLCALITQSYDAAWQWFELAADQGHTGALFQLGYCYEHELGVASDPAETIRLYTLAAKQGHSEAQHKLGTHYHDKAEYDQAVYWYTKAAENGDANAASSLASCYYYGHGMDPDYVRAVEYYTLAAKLGSGYSQKLLGHWYAKGHTVDGTLVVEADETMSLYWYSLAAEQGDLESQLYLGRYYYSRWYNDGQPRERAASRYEINDINNTLWGSFHLEDYYESLPERGGNLEQAAYWYTLAADQGDAVGMNDLAKCLTFQRIDSDAETKYWQEQAASLWAQAAELGLAGAQFNLGCCYWNGEGLAKDEAIAIEWFERAAAQDHEAASKFLASLE